MRQADVEFTVRTDLALEEREKVQGSEIPGIRVREWEKEEAGIRVTEVAVCDERGEKALGSQPPPSPTPAPGSPESHSPVPSPSPPAPDPSSP